MKYHLIIIAVLLLTSFGCSGRQTPQGMPAIKKCTIYVKIDGTPLAGANVTLFPESEPDWISGGITDASGKLSPSIMGQYVGVPLGKSKVTVSKKNYEIDQEMLAKMSVPNTGDPKEDAKFQRVNEDAATIITEIVEASFTKMGTTSLEVNITKNGQSFTLEVHEAK